MAESLGTATLDLTTNDARLRSGLRGAESESRGVFGRIGASAAKMALVVGGAFAVFVGGKFLKGAVDAAADYQKTMNMVAAVTNSGAEDMAKLSKRAIQLGSDIHLPGASAKDAADAMLELGKAGFSTTQILASTRDVLLLAAAGEVDTATAADLVSKAIGAMNLQASDAKEVVNDFAGAALASQSSLVDVGEAMEQAGSAFAALRVPIGDAATAIAIMAKNGITGGMAGAALNTAFSRLAQANSIPKVKKTLDGMNVSLFDSNGKFVGMRSAIAQMSPKLAAMSDQQRLSTLAILGGTRGMKALSFVLGAGVKDWDKLKDAVTRHGQAQQLADAQTKGFHGAMGALGNALETLQIQIGLKLLPVLTRFVRWLTAELPGAVKVAGSILGAIGAAIGAAIGTIVDAVRDHMAEIRSVVSTGVSAVKTAFDALKGPIQIVAEALRGVFDYLNANRDVVLAIAAGVATLAAGFLLYNTALLVVRGALLVAAAAQAVLNAVMYANPIGLVIVALAALVASLVLLYQRSETARRVMDAAWAGIKQGAQAALDFISNVVIPRAIAAWNRFGPEVVAFLQTAATRIRTAVQAIADIVERVVDQIEQNWRGVWNTFGPLVVAAFQVVRTTVQTQINIIRGVIEVFTALLRGDWGDAWNALKGIVSSALAGVVSIVGSILRGLAGTSKALAEAIGGKIADGIKTAPSKLAGLAGDLAGKISSVAGQVAGSAFALMRQVGFAIADGILSGIGNLAGRLASKISSMIGSALGAIDIPGRSPPEHAAAEMVGMPIAAGIVRGFVEKIKDLGPKVSDELVKAMKGRFDAASKTALAAIETTFAQAQARLDAWKARLTPAEMLMQAAQASAALEKVRADVSAAAAALNTMPAAQAKAWSQLLAQQKQNMAALQATLVSTRDDAVLAGHAFEKGMATATGNPFAQALIDAQGNFDFFKQKFDEGIATQAEFLASADRLEAAKLAAQQAIDVASASSTEVTEAQKTAAIQAAQAQQLLDQFNTYNAALTQQTAAGAAVTAQQAADLEAQKALQDQQHIDLETAREAYEGTIAARDDYWLGQAATKQRAARDAEADRLNKGLVARHDRIKLHYENVQELVDDKLDTLAAMASKSGKDVVENMARALEKAKPTLTAALNTIAGEIAKYLKTNSPTELGPMSDLDKWGRGFAPAYLKGIDRKLITNFMAGAVNPALNRGLMGGYASDSSVAAGRSGGPVTLSQTFNHTPANADPVAIGAVTTWAMRNLRS